MDMQKRKLRVQATGLLGHNADSLLENEKKKGEKKANISLFLSLVTMSLAFLPTPALLSL